MIEKSSDISALFGEVLREMREENDLTQEKLAELSDLHTNYISLLERGKRKPTIDTIFKIASAFEIQPYQLIKKMEKRVNN